MAIRGEGSVLVHGVTAQEVFDFVLDPRQYTRADTKMIWVTKLADTDDGMIAREDGRFLGRFRGSVVTRYRWHAPDHIDVTLEHGIPRALHAWFEIEPGEGGTRLRHVEEIDFGHGFWGRCYDVVARRWFARAVEEEVGEIARLLESGERGRGIDAHRTS
jgi:Polyketide cyclase / dehydrase and lipid transport